MVVCGAIPLAASLVATYNQRTAARIYLWVAPISALLFLLFGRGIFLTAAIFSGAILVPLFFWRWASRGNWPPLLAKSLSRRPRLAASLGSALFCVLLVVAFFWSLGLPFWDPIADCGGRPLLEERGVPYGIDFTARIIFVGPRTFQGWSLWSIARIEERFSGLQWWAPDFIIHQGFFKPGDRSKRYFVEGTRTWTALTRFLPVIQRVDCGRTGPLDLAGVEVRMLRDGPPKFGARLIGHVCKFEHFSRRPINGAELSIEGPSGTTVSTTDAQGIYDANSLTPGRSKVRLMRDEIVVDLKAGEIRNENFVLR